MRVSTEVGLPVPVEQAWRALLEWESQPDWMKDADTVIVTSPDREGLGVRIEVRTRVLGVPAFTERLEVIAWEPPTRLLMAHRSFIRGTGEWKLVPAGGGCRFRWTEDLSLPPPIIGEAALQIYKPFMRWLMGGASGNFRRFVERSGSP